MKDWQMADWFPVLLYGGILILGSVRQLYRLSRRPGPSERKFALVTFSLFLIVVSHNMSTCYHRAQKRYEQLTWLRALSPTDARQVLLNGVLLANPAPVIETLHSVAREAVPEGVPRGAPATLEIRTNNGEVHCLSVCLVDGPQVCKVAPAERGATGLRYVGSPAICPGLPAALAASGRRLATPLAGSPARGPARVGASERNSGA